PSLPPRGASVRVALADRHLPGGRAHLLGPAEQVGEVGLVEGAEELHPPQVVEARGRVPAPLGAGTGARRHVTPPRGSGARPARPWPPRLRPRRCASPTWTARRRPRTRPARSSPASRGRACPPRAAGPRR